MASNLKVQLYHTRNANNNPLATNMLDGEIAINMAADNEKLYIKNTNEQIVEFLPANKLQEKLTSGESIKTINNESILGNGNVNVGEIVARDTSETLDDVYGNIDLTPYATKVDLTSKQNNLVSGDNIKTINGESILGGGDIKIGNKKLISFTEGTITLTPNTYYRNTNTSLSALTITLGTITDDTIFNEFFIEFTTRSSGTTVALPSAIKWVNGIAPVFDNGSTYQISIVNNWGICVKFA